MSNVFVLLRSANAPSRRVEVLVERVIAEMAKLPTAEEIEAYLAYVITLMESRLSKLSGRGVANMSDEPATTKRLRALDLARRVEALPPFVRAMVEDELERLEESQREAERLGRDPTERLN